MPTRLEICREFALHECRLVGMEWRTDADLQLAWQRWIAAGRPKRAVISAGEPISSAVVPAPRASRPVQGRLF